MGSAPLVAEIIPTKAVSRRKGRERMSDKPNERLIKKLMKVPEYTGAAFNKVNHFTFKKPCTLETKFILVTVETRDAIVEALGGGVRESPYGDKLLAYHRRQREAKRGGRTKDGSG